MRRMGLKEFLEGGPAPDPPPARKSIGEQFAAGLSPCCCCGRKPEFQVNRSDWHPSFRLACDCGQTKYVHSMLYDKDRPKRLGLSSEHAHYANDWKPELERIWDACFAGKGRASTNEPLEHARAEWRAAQDKLARIESRLVAITGEEASIFDNIELLASAWKERK